MSKTQERTDLAELIRQWNPAGPDHLFNGINLTELGEDGGCIAAAGHVDPNVMAQAAEEYLKWSDGEEEVDPAEVAHILVAIADDEHGDTMVWWGDGHGERTIPMTAVWR